MLKLFLLYIIVLSSFSIGAELLEEKDIEYVSTNPNPNPLLVEEVNGGPVGQAFSNKMGKGTIYSPQINKETLDMVPRPQMISSLIASPGAALTIDAEKAIKKFQDFAKSFRECVSSNKWPSNNVCIEKFDFCFEGSEFLCNSAYQPQLAKCSNGRFSDLKKCLKSNQTEFEIVRQCFNDKLKYDLTFEVFGVDASRREYYTIDVTHYDVNKDVSTFCRFTYFDNRYHLISVAYESLGRPNWTVLPLKIYGQDNYKEQIQIQRNKRK